MRSEFTDYTDKVYIFAYPILLGSPTKLAKSLVVKSVVRKKIFDCHMLQLLHELVSVINRISGTVVAD